MNLTSLSSDKKPKPVTLFIMQYLKVPTQTRLTLIQAPLLLPSFTVLESKGRQLSDKPCAPPPQASLRKWGLFTLQ